MSTPLNDPFTNELAKALEASRRELEAKEKQDLKLAGEESFMTAIAEEEPGQIDARMEAESKEYDEAMTLSLNVEETLLLEQYKQDFRKKQEEEGTLSEAVALSIQLHPRAEEISEAIDENFEIVFSDEELALYQSMIADSEKEREIKKTDEIAKLDYDQGIQKDPEKEKTEGKEKDKAKDRKESKEAAENPQAIAAEPSRESQNKRLAWLDRNQDSWKKSKNK